MQTEEESDSDPDYDVKQKSKTNKKKKHFKENEDKELKEECYFESNSELSSEVEKEETQENLQNEEDESENEQLDKLEIENSENSDKYDFWEERPPPEPPPDLPSTSGLSDPHKNVIECQDQLTMRKDNYVYKANLEETTRNIELAIYSKNAKNLDLKSISIAKSPHVNHVLWEEILATLKIAFLNSSIKIIICNGTT